MPRKIANSPLLQRLGTHIRKLRTTKRDRNGNTISQEALAHAAGLDRGYVSGLERGEFNISVLKLAAVAKALGVKISSLFEGD